MRLVLLVAAATVFGLSPAYAGGRFAEAPQDLRCAEPNQPTVAKVQIARAVALAVIAEKQSAEVQRRFELAIVDQGKAWSVFQVSKTRKSAPDRRGAWKVDAGAGGLAFRIAKCDGMISKNIRPRRTRLGHGPERAFERRPARRRPLITAARGRLTRGPRRPLIPLTPSETCRHVRGPARPPRPNPGRLRRPASGAKFLSAARDLLGRDRHRRASRTPRPRSAWPTPTAAWASMRPRRPRSIRVLALEPRNLRALILKGDHLHETGDRIGATAFYNAALRTAPPGQIEPELRQELARAHAVCARYAEEREAFLRERLAASGFADGALSSRFAQSMDLMLGRKQLYLQEPKYYYFPGLPQIQFYDRSAFPWLDAVEAATDDIRGELIDVLKDEAAFAPYVEGETGRPSADYQGLLNNPAWGAYYLWKNGSIVPDHAARCPKTLKALEAAPLTHAAARMPSVLFSRLEPGARIPPHNGFINARLIVHLPLIVPGKCRFRVGNDVREWREGEAWVFDDTIEHEAWNDSGETRVILLFEIWRPELSETERAQVTALFEAIDAYGDAPADWGV